MNTAARNLGDDRRRKRRYPDSRWAAPETIDLCKSLYIDQGISASQTAARLGPGFTRNMVISLGHREGWKRSPELARANIARSAAASSAAKPRRSPPPKPRSGPPLPPRALVDQTAVTTPLDVTLARPWMERELGQCAWPIEIDGETYSCCAPTLSDSPGDQYCPGHRKRLYKPQAAGKRRITMRDLERTLRRYA